MYNSSTALVEVAPGQTGMPRIWLRGKGKLKSLQTLFEMRRIIRESLGLDGAQESAELAELADAILDAWNVRTGSEYEINRAIYEWIADNISYAQDRAGGNERLQWPLETVRRKRGDCDDLEILAAALLGLCGIQDVWLEAAKYNEETEGEDHVYGFSKVRPEYSLDRSGIIYHDLTGAITENRPLGWHEENNIEWVRVPVFEDTHNTLVSGLSGFWSTLISIGGIAAAPFTGGLSIPISGVGAGIVGQAEAKGAQAKEVGKAFEQGAAGTVALFNQIESQAVITAEDYNKAAAALSQLAAFVEQYPVEYVTKKWNDPNYKQAFETRLQKIKLRLAGGEESGGGNATANETGGGILDSSGGGLLAIALIAVAALFVGGRILGR